MKKNGKAKQERNPPGRIPTQPKGVTELTDRDLERVQGGLGGIKHVIDKASPTW